MTIAGSFAHIGVNHALKSLVSMLVACFMFVSYIPFCQKSEKEGVKEAQ